MEVSWTLMLSRLVTIKETGKQAINVHYDKPENDNHNGWYLRFENNGWRPINDKVLAQVD
jgi:hypothetical protein